MALPASSITSLAAVLLNLQNLSISVKFQAQNALTTLQSGPVNSLFIFQFLDQMKGLIEKAEIFVETPPADVDHALAALIHAFGPKRAN